jgi:hypothetical protein
LKRLSEVSEEQVPITLEVLSVEEKAHPHSVMLDVGPIKPTDCPICKQPYPLTKLLDLLMKKIHKSFRTQQEECSQIEVIEYTRERCGWIQDSNERQRKYTRGDNVTSGHGYSEIVTC